MRIRKKAKMRFVLVLCLAFSAPWIIQGPRPAAAFAPPATSAFIDLLTEFYDWKKNNRKRSDGTNIPSQYIAAAIATTWGEVKLPTLSRDVKLMAGRYSAWLTAKRSQGVDDADLWGVWMCERTRMGAHACHQWNHPTWNPFPSL